LIVTTLDEEEARRNGEQNKERLSENSYLTKVALSLVLLLMMWRIGW
jgi:hypothetical protein